MSRELCDYQKHLTRWLINLLCSFSNPNNLILLASCWAFFFKRQAREANLFFSLRVFGRTLKGSSLTGVMSLITRPSLSNSFPIALSFLGFGVRSFPSPLRAFPLCFIWMDLSDYWRKQNRIVNWLIVGSFRKSQIRKINKILHQLIGVMIQWRNYC